MSYDTLRTTLSFPVGAGQSISFAYPSGRTAESYRPQGAVLTASDGVVAKQVAGHFSVIYGSSSITVSYGAGPHIAAGVTLLNAPLSDKADVAGSPNLVSLSQAAYDALATKDSNTVYLIVG